MNILLDLNYTLVGNNPPRGSKPISMEKRMATEAYRQWLIELVKPHTVILITARPESWMLRTLERIEEQTGWKPQDACFAPKGWWNPPSIKEHLLKKHVFPTHGREQRYLAIESNPRSREMYGRYEIPCLWVNEDGDALTDGTRIIKRLPR
jgi:hypothetical protein